MSNKRNRNKKAWSRQRRTRPHSAAAQPPLLVLARRMPRIHPTTQPSELDQIGAMIVEEELGFPTTNLDDLRVICGRLPSEPALSLLAMLARRWNRPATTR